MQALVVTPIDTAIAVSWSAPATDGGSPLIGYIARVTPGTGVCTSTGPTSCIATGLVNGKKYNVRVWAYNAIGHGKVARDLHVVPTTAQNCSYIGEYADLQGCNLANSKFAGIDLAHANLTNANLYRSDLSHTDLTDTVFSGTSVANVNFAGADLQGADLSGATNMSTITSGGVTGTPAALPTGWNVVGGYLMGPGVQVANSNLSNVTFPAVDLTGANLYRDNLSGATITGATVFSGTSVANVNFAGADLQGADLSGATNIGTALWSHTTCPDGSDSNTNGSSPATCIGYGI